jgi:hypothetical protein
MLGLAVLTVKAARDGVWLLLFMIAPASHTPGSRRDWNGLIPPALVLGVVLLIFGVVHRPPRAGASQQMVARALTLAHGAPILADGLPAEQVALAGGRIWAGNPLDAFSRRVQTQYVDFLTGDPRGVAALDAPAVRFVLVTRGSAADALTARDRAYRQVAADSSAIVFERSG